MVAHLNIPSIDSTPNLASTLSKPIVTGLLKNKLGFKGLTFTDALSMNAVTKYFKPGEVDVKALIAGNDGLIFSKNIPIAIQEIKKAVKNGLISQKEIDARCYKQLKAKEWAGLNNLQPIKTKNLISDLNKPKAKLLNRNLIQASLTVLRNKNDILPIKDLLNTKIASLSIGVDTLSVFQQRLADYTKVDHFYMQKTVSNSSFNSIKKSLDNYDMIICSVHDIDLTPRKSFGFTKQMADMLNFISEHKNAVVVVFGNAYSLKELDKVQLSRGLIVAYQESDNAQDLSAQLIFGGIGAKGTLPVTVNKHFKEGDGIKTAGGIRFKYTLPEELGMDSEFINSKIDSIANKSIKLGAFPGVQVFAAKNGKVFFHKTYGYHTYDKKRPVRKTNIYDFASVTKITGALPSLMKLHDEGKFQLDVPFATYWPDFKRSNKKEMTVREVLAHQSGMEAWVAFWKNTKKKNGKFKWHTFKPDSSAKYPIKITSDLFLYKNYKRKIYKSIRKTKMGEKKYKYSGLSFYLYPEIINNITNKGYESYSKKNFYESLGAYTITYNPSRYFPKNMIIPTEKDTFFRMTQIHGNVHDEGAAMMGGFSSNAGLFGTAGDLAKIMQMYLQMGQYGGVQYISKATMLEFTKCQYPKNNNRRGLAFDKPFLKDKNKSSCGPTPTMAYYLFLCRTGYTQQEITVKFISITLGLQFIRFFMML
ncbi:MAG: hypothetical protein B6I20_14675 [Bacteroidetes bacterium 4572_117]|nr:MAG: hypothetical protein B6I20_14675 [Bacteroidetes bacterium 4572_117]